MFNISGESEMGRKARSEEKIIAAIMKNGPMTFAEIVKATKLPKPTTSHAIRRLARKRFIQPLIADDGKVRWGLHPRALIYVPLVSEFFSRLEEEDKKLASLLFSPPEEWGREEWETIFGVIEELFSMISRNGGEMPLELREKLARAVESLINEWRFLKNEFFITYTLMLLAAIVSLYNIRNDPGGLEAFKVIYIPKALKKIAELIEEYFIEILENTMNVRLRDSPPEKEGREKQ